MISKTEEQAGRSAVEGAMEHGPRVWFSSSCQIEGRLSHLSTRVQLKRNIASLESPAD
jgi:hypothetical protein